MRVTNDNEVALEAAGKVANLLRAAIEGGDWRGMEFPGETGIACDLPKALPLIGRLLADAESYEAGVRANILAGGDNCGRATVLGAVLGAAYGVPAEWQKNVPALERARELLDRLN